MRRIRWSFSASGGAIQREVADDVVPDGPNSWEEYYLPRLSAGATPPIEFAGFG
jgi:hypothetical protein